VHPTASKFDRLSAAVLLVLAVQIAFVHSVATSERLPWPPDFERFPARFGTWVLSRQDPIDPAIAKELGSDRLLSQSFLEIPGGSSASLLVAWFQTQRDGARQPHSPKVCLPGAGWTPRVVDEFTLDTRAGTIRVNRYVVNKAAERAVVLYWYQTPKRAIAGEWAAKFWLAADALRDRRTDTSLVRVIVGVKEGDGAATQTAARFARDLYPMLHEYLPH